MAMDANVSIDRVFDMFQDIKSIIERFSDYCGEDKKQNETQLEKYSEFAKTITHKHQLIKNILKMIEISRDEILLVIGEMMDKQQIKEFETDSLMVRVKRNPPRLVIPDESKVDKDYFYEKKVLDKVLVSQHLKDGLIVKGAELVQDDHVEIKYKPVKAKDLINE